MPLIRDELAALIQTAIRQAQAAGDLPSFDIPPVAVEHPKQASHGDYATNIALQLAKPAGMAPPKIAQTIVRHLPAADAIGEVAIAGPGFINIMLSSRWLAQQVDAIRAAGPAWANLDLGQGRAAQVEFVSANPTGPLHIGRTWGAVLGDSIARLLEAAGYVVTREYYFNNAGRQMQILGLSVRARYRELIGRPAEFPEDGYQGDYITDIARAIVAEQGEAWVDADWPPFKERAEAWLFDDIRRTLERLGVIFDVWFNENSLYIPDASGTSAIQRTVQALRERGYAYDKDGAVWFRATLFGADKDRVLIKSTGEPTYRLPDIAYHVNKLERGFQRIVNIFGADHKDEYPDVIAGVKALGYPVDGIQVVIHQFINLVREGKQVRMSTRRANYVTLDDLLDEVTITHPESGVTIPGKDPVRFMLLTRSPDSPMNFDLDLVTQQTNENPVYYVQYAHARICSILNKATEEGWRDWESGDVTLLTHPAELTLIRKLLELPEVIASAVEKLTPHQLSFYAMDLAAIFHAFYRDCRVLSSVEADIPLSHARLKLVDATRITLARTLDLMGMTAPERM